MDLDRAVCDRARRSRDPRFDGRFFIGVTSTRIHCRPICPVRAPKDENIRYFPTAAAAEAAGYRPCLRCRPEASPGSPAWAGTSGIVSRGLRLIGTILRRGIELIHKQLLEALRRRGVEPYDSVGQTFDPTWHEAISYETGTDLPEGEIIGEVRRGYRIGQRLLRPSQVRVARA